MPTIGLLDLTVSLDSNGEVAAQVAYTLEFSDAEIAANVSFAERVVVARRIGALDEYSIQALPGPQPGVQLVVAQAPGDTSDEVISVLVDTTSSFDSFGVPAVAPASVQRSFRRVLTPTEVSSLLEVGREHPYALVTVLPVGITSDVQLAQVEIDVGDPTGTQAADDFHVGSAPSAVVFDGSSIWVANRDSNDVTRLSLDGVTLGTFKVGNTPTGIAFDGSRIWVANAGEPILTVLSADNGALVATIAVGANPTAVAIAGDNIWVAAGDGHVRKLNVQGANLGTFAVGTSPSALAFDGESVWVTSEVDATVTRLREADGLLLGKYPVGNTPLAVAFFGDSLWVANWGDATVSKLRATDGFLPAGTFPVGQGPIAFAFGTDQVWVSNSGSNTVTRLRASDGSIESTIAVGANPGGIAYDRHSIWVTSQTDNTVSKRPA